MLKRLWKNWRFARLYGSTRRRALRIALRSLRRKRDYVTDADLIDAYRCKNERRD
jgi:hypothetical protein